MITKRSDDPYVVILGSGLAAFATSVKLAAQGHRVKVISKGPGATALSSGAWDVAGCPCQSPFDLWSELTLISQNLHQVIKGNEFHPYAILAPSCQNGDFYGFIEGSMEQAAKELPHPMVGFKNENRVRVTQMGTLKTTAWVQESQASLDLTEMREAKLLIAGIRGLPHFHARFIRDSLELAQENQSGDHISFSGYLDIEIPDFVGKSNLSSLEIAHFLDKEENFVKFGKAIVTYIEGKVYSHLLLPPLLGIKNTHLILEAINKITGLECAEVLSVSPSVPGFRLFQAIKQYFSEKNIELICGEAVAFEHLAGNIKYLDVQTEEEVVKIPTRALVLTTGKFLGGGISAGPPFKEALMGLPVYCGPRRVDEEKVSLDVSARPFDSQVFLSAGIRIDAQCRPLNERGDVAFENLFAAGSIIGGVDSSHEQCASGVAVVTGFVAGENVLKMI